MKTNYTRRNFLKLSGTGLAAAAIPAGGTGLADFHFLNGSPQERKIDRWITSADRKHQSVSPLRWEKATQAPSTEAITIDAGQRYQTILGFGAALTDASCYQFSRLSESARAPLFHDLFHPSEMNLSVCRTCIGASDYSVRLYSYDDGQPDPELSRFSIEHDRSYILPALREARRVNPDLFLFSSPWSPPGWMKAGGSMLGGSIRPRYLSVYARYLLKFLQAYAAEGVPLQAITVQNEVDTDQDGRMPACLWPQESEMRFVRLHLGPLFEREGIRTKIWLIDHNYSLWGRAIDELEDPGVRQYADAIAWHGYDGSPERMTRVHQAFPGTDMHWTEGGPDINDPEYSRDWCNWGKTFTDVLHNWCTSITAWNVILDEKGQPNIGPFYCGGVVTVDSTTRRLSYSGQYWALAHFSRHIRRGAKRIASQSSQEAAHHAAFENPDGKFTAVLTNPGPARECEVRWNGWKTDISLERNSLTTLVWR